VFDWPKDGKLLFPMASQATKARLLADARKSLPVTKTEQGATIQLPPTAPDGSPAWLSLKSKINLKMWDKMSSCPTIDGAPKPGS